MREKEFLPLVSERLGIKELNAMQRKTMEAASEPRDIILLSPTGSGKTLAFLLPVLKIMRPSTGRVQAVIIAPSRELVLQIYSVAREIAPGLKVTPLYGGHKVEDEVNSLSDTPDIVVATPGRLLDHINRRNIDVLPCRVLVLDEFDKSLELGFEDDMRKIVNRMKNVSRIILTSATDMDILPEFLKLNNPLRLSFLGNTKEVRARQRVHKVESDNRDKLQSLLALLKSLPREKAIVFANYRESAERIAEFLHKQGVRVTLYHGALDQHERETALTRFRNGSAPVLVATDLAARGLDIEGVKSIIHYHQPLTPEAWTHRNGRTARVAAEGDIYVLIGPDEDVKPYVNFDDTYYPAERTEASVGEPQGVTETLRFSAGRKEKISRGDIVGFLVNKGGLEASQIGLISVFDHYALAAVTTDNPKHLLDVLNSEKIKGQKCRITVV